MYRASPHSTTKMSPAELMFNRKIKDKLPSFIQFKETDDELRDRDKVMKQKGKEYADENRHAKPNEIKEGDLVLLKRLISPNKLATKFEPTVFKVVKRTGSEIVVLNEATGTTYRRNVAHAKKVDDQSQV